MGWYVFALVDDLPAGKPGTGLTGPLGIRRVGSILAVVERRADVPPAEFGTLQRHQAVVSDLAARVPAILPVRFGTLLDTDALEEVLGEREEDVADGFDLVRGRVQFTWRPKQVRGPRSEIRDPRSEVRGPTSGVRSGTDYLRRAARSMNPAAPAAWRTLRSKLKPLVVCERYQPAIASAPESLYHLVARTNVTPYQRLGAEFVSAGRKLVLTGPFPPFAFTPELL